MTVEAKVVLTAQDRTGQAFRSVNQSLRGMQSAAMTVKSVLGTIGVGLSVGAVVTGFTRAAAAAIRFGDDIAKASAKTGVAASTFSELAYAARQNDVPLEALGTAFKKLQVSISEAGSGSKSAAATFKALGIEFESFRRLAPDQQFERIAEQISRLKDPADRARAAVELFGRSGADLLPLFEQGAAGIRALREEAVKMGRSLTEEQVAKLAEADLAIKNLTASWDSFARTLTAKVAPALSSVLNTLSNSDQGKLDAVRKSQIDALLKSRGPTASFFPDNDALQRELAQINQRERDRLLGRGRQATRNLPAVSAPPGFVPQDKPTRAGSSSEPGLSLIDTERLDAKRLFSMTDAIRDIDAEWQRGSAKIAVDISNNLDSAVTEVTERWGEEMRAEMSNWSVFADEAARSIQTSFADFLFDPFKEGLDGMLSGFLDTIRRMVAEIAAQEILRSLFSWAGGAIGGSIGKFVSGLALPGRASGGPVTAGSAYLVGERGPEMFVPRTSGSIIPNGVGGAVNVSYHIDARGADAERIMAVLPGMLENTKRQTVAEVLRLQRAGRLA